MNRIILVLFAFILDLLVGDPRSIIHPVQVMGCLISFLEKKLNKKKQKGILLLRGFVLVVIVVSLSYFFFAFLNQYIAQWPVLFWGLNIWFAGTVLAGRSLASSALDVYRPLIKGDLAGAREALAMIVGRDCENLGEKEIIKATIETVAENTSDGIIAPLFYLLIGGVPLAMAYKAVNTMDSMLGYKNERYLWFGRTAALLDDAVNLIPARLTAVLLVIAAFCQGHSWRLAWQILKRDRYNHLSPNSGWPEAAMAGALGLALGGENTYQGVKVKKPVLGVEKCPPEAKHIKNAIALLGLTYGLAVVLGLLSIFIFKALVC